MRGQTIQAIKRPTSRAQRSLFNLIKNTESLVMEESEWIRHGPDLAALSHGSQHGWLNGAIEDVLSLFSTRFTTVSNPFSLSVYFLPRVIPFIFVVHCGRGRHPITKEGTLSS